MVGLVRLNEENTLALCKRFTVIDTWEWVVVADWYIFSVLGSQHTCVGYRLFSSSSNSKGAPKGEGEGLIACCYKSVVA